MPVYEYKCSACGREFEYQQRMSDAPKDVCEACGGKLERLISRTAFQLKGGGWYKDLYSSSKPAESAAAKPAGEASTSTETKTEAKPKTDPGTGTGTGTGTGSGGGGGSGTGTGGGATSAAAGSAK